MITIKTRLRRRDVRQAIRFAISGMHFDWYLDSRFLLWLYGRYFWYKEQARATRCFAACEDRRFLGVLLAEAYGEPPLGTSRWARGYVKAFDWIAAHFFKGGPDVYERTTAALLRRYQTHTRPDGEILFLAADPAAQVPGVGTALLRALEKAEAGKTFFLQTDNACTWQFYEHRGFVRAEEAAIVLEMPKGRIPLDCFLYSKDFMAAEVKGGAGDGVWS